MNAINNTRIIGKRAEEEACNFLMSQNYKLVAKNWTCFGGEIDLIVKKHKLIFVEVKSVGKSEFCKPHDLFNYKKKERLHRAINLFLNKYNLNSVDWQLDLICIRNNGKKKSLIHYKNIEL